MTLIFWTFNPNNAWYSRAKEPRVELLYGKHKIVPISAHGMSIISIGLIVEPEQAVVLRGPRLAGLVKQFVSECLWPDLDYIVVIFLLEPGTYIDLGSDGSSDWCSDGDDSTRSSGH